MNVSDLLHRFSTWLFMDEAETECDLCDDARWIHEPHPTYGAQTVRCPACNTERQP